MALPASEHHQDQQRTTQDSFPLGDETSATITLPDGRELGYARFGLDQGLTIICLHGLPGSRFDFARSDAPAKEVGASIISVDIPGFGLSSPHAEATLLSVAGDIEHLTNALELNSYAVLGGSAGGPYALACAYALPANKLKAVTVVCGIGSSDMSYKGTDWVRWTGFKYASWIPVSVFRWFWSQDPGSAMHLSPEEHLELLRSHAIRAKPHEREAGLFTTDDSIRLWLKTSREAFRRGVEPTVQSTYRLASDWGFRLRDIRPDLPVLLWYGTYDRVAPVSHGEELASKIGKNAQLTVKDETHGSMFANQTRAYLTQLVASMREVSAMAE